MDINLIKTEADYRAVLKQVSALIDLDPAPDTEDGDKLELLGMLVEAYEAKHFPLEAPTPVEAIKFRMEQSGLTVSDLEPMIGHTNRVYEVLAKKRPLSIGMIRKLHSGLGIPADVLIQA